jgi:hypothetical protein
MQLIYLVSSPSFCQEANPILSVRAPYQQAEQVLFYNVLIAVHESMGVHSAEIRQKEKVLL